MYILTDYRLILIKKQKTDPTSRQRGHIPSGTALARTSSNSKLQTRPLVRECATKLKKPQLSKRMSQGERKIGRGSQMGA
jgi:hypothetical protein